MIAKLEPYNKGVVLYDNKGIKEIKDYIYYRDYLGYLFQNFELIESESVAANLE